MFERIWRQPKWNNRATFLRPLRGRGCKTCQEVFSNDANGWYVSVCACVIDTQCQCVSACMGEIESETKWQTEIYSFEKTERRKKSFFYLRSRFASMTSMAASESLSCFPAKGAGVVVPLHAPLRVLTFDDLETLYLTSRTIVFFITTAFLKGISDVHGSPYNSGEKKDTMFSCSQLLNELS